MDEPVSLNEEAGKANAGNFESSRGSYEQR